MKKLVSILLASVLTFSMSASVFANPSNEIDKDKLLGKINNEIQALNKEYNTVNITIEPSQLTDEFVNEVVSMSDDELHNYLEEIYKENEEFDYELKEISEEPQFQTLAVTTHKNKVGKVFWGVPAIGYVYMFIVYDIKMDGNQFVSGTVTDSYQDGLAIGSWSHKRGEVKVQSNKLYADVQAIGVLTYGLSGTPFKIETEQTVQYTDSWQNYK